MSPTPQLIPLIGRTERALFPLMDVVLAGTGGTFHQWVALNFTAVSGESIERSQLIARLTDALSIDDAAAAAVLTELAAEGLLQAESESVVALSDAGRERYAAIRAAIDQTTAPLFADIPVDELTTAGRVLSTIAERADVQLARA
jgi:hypothetical protein